MKKKRLNKTKLTSKKDLEIINLRKEIKRLKAKLSGRKRQTKVMRQTRDALIETLSVLNGVKS
jgi:hypothetical protein